MLLSVFATLTALTVNCEIVGTNIVSLWESMEVEDVLTTQQKSCMTWNKKRMEDLQQLPPPQYDY